MRMSAPLPHDYPGSGALAGYCTALEADNADAALARAM
jgi:hypothetical protein